MTDFCYPVYNELSSLSLCVCGAGIRQPAGIITREGAYGFYNLLLCIGGEGKVITADKKFSVKSGSIMFIPKGTAHQLVPAGEGWRLLCLELDGKGIEELLEAVKLVKPRCDALSQAEGFARRFIEIIELVKKGGSSLPWESSGLAYELIMKLHREINIDAHNPDGQKYSQLAPVIEYIEENYPNDMTLDKLAGMLDISPQYLCRLFKECYKMRPFEYLARKRIQVAKQMLVQEGYSVNEVSQLVGYNDCSYFCSVFKKHEGISPAEFKAHNCPAAQKLT